MIELTRSGKTPLIIETPVMPAAGTFGFDGGAYRDLLDLTKLGAIVTNPITWKARHAARGPRVVPLPSGVLVHTGLPNPGLPRVIQRYGASWARSPIPVIVHIVVSTSAEVARCAVALEAVEGVAGIELGLHDEATADDIVAQVRAAVNATLHPVLVRVPLYRAVEAAQAAAEGGAGGIVVAAPPRGTVRDPLSGQLVGGRVYGPLVHAQALRAVGQVARAISLPVIGCGGVHTPEDARDLLEAGAVAVQVDSVTWTQPRQLEVIARNLGGLEVTRVSGALADEWEPGLGETRLRERRARRGGPRSKDTPAPVPPPPPPDLPE